MEGHRTRAAQGSSGSASWLGHPEELQGGDCQRSQGVESSPRPLPRVAVACVVPAAGLGGRQGHGCLVLRVCPRPAGEAGARGSDNALAPRCQRGVDASPGFSGTTWATSLFSQILAHVRAFRAGLSAWRTPPTSCSLVPRTLLASPRHELGVASKARPLGAAPRPPQMLGGSWAPEDSGSLGGSSRGPVCGAQS